MLQLAKWNQCKNVKDKSCTETLLKIKLLCDAIDLGIRETTNGNNLASYDTTKLMLESWLL